MTAYINAMGLPRMRGGVSHLRKGSLCMRMSSPHARGCFRWPGMPSEVGRVFPACAGVFPTDQYPDLPYNRLPRMRGGVSRQDPYRKKSSESSPHARGCFSGLLDDLITRQVFPACAGVFLTGLMPCGSPESLPRMRGGVSDLVEGVGRSIESSPHARGCFYLFRPT